MNESEKNQNLELSSETEDLINSRTVEDVSRVEKIERLRQKHAEDKAKMRKEISKAEDKNMEIGTKLEETEDELLRKTKENEKLRKELINSKKFSTMTEVERQMSESEKVGLMALKIIDKRIAERYGNK
jgi:hypothetical protein